MRFRNKQLRITLHNYDLVLSKLATGRGRRASERQVPSVFPLGTDTYGEVRNSLYNPTEGFEGYEPRRGIRRGALAPGLAWQSSRAFAGAQRSIARLKRNPGFNSWARIGPNVPSGGLEVCSYKKI